MGVYYPKEFQLLMSFAPAPVNDNFEEAIILEGAHAQAVGSTLRGTVQPGEPLHVPGLLYASSWYSWTAPGDGEVRLQFGDGFLGYPTFAIYTGNALTNLVRVSAGGSAFVGFNTFHAQSNVTYRLALIVLNGEFPTIPFTLSFQASAAAAAAAPLARLNLPEPVPPPISGEPPEAPNDVGLTIVFPTSSGSGPSPGVHLHLRARSTTECVLETSDDLANWTPLTTLSVSNTPLEYVDKPAANVSARFYRLVKPQ
jgi:hypothetical protein